MSRFRCKAAVKMRHKVSREPVDNPFSEFKVIASVGRGAEHLQFGPAIGGSGGRKRYLVSSVSARVQTPVIFKEFRSTKGGYDITLQTSGLVSLNSTRNTESLPL
eukprot:1374817-Amorphochlora_amoeboformis.AAC.1